MSAVFETAFTLLATPVSWLELAAFVLAFACVLLGIVESHWNWPFSVVSSALYAWVFAASRLYGEAALQGVFIGISLWGWWQWRFGTRPLQGAGTPGGFASRLTVQRLQRGRAGVLLAWALLWPALGVLLAWQTDSDVPYLDALATSGSVIAQALLGRKLIENWLLWLFVDAISVGLFAYKGLHLTALLYAVFVLLAFAGWLRWRRVLRDQTPAST